MQLGTSGRYDAIVIGGGFYGCAVALELRSLGQSVLLLEQHEDLMLRASYANQARIHQGYHYPRSVLTALRSRVNFDRFVGAYGDCVYDQFDKYYALGKLGSKVNAAQFRQFCQRIGAPIEKAPREIIDLFNPNLIEDVFLVKEYAFDAKKLQSIMRDALDAAGVELLCHSRVERIEPASTGVAVLADCEGTLQQWEAGFVFSCTYSAINRILHQSSLTTIPLKHELTEMALVKMAEPLQSIGLTVMDGPFFSTMPFPSRGLHSFSHVRYTPHNYWQDTPGNSYRDCYRDGCQPGIKSKFVNMVKDAERYMPMLRECEYIDSLWEVKTVLPQSEVDDSRPILFRRNEELPNVISIMGGKIDNIFEVREQLVELLKAQGE